MRSGQTWPADAGETAGKTAWSTVSWVEWIREWKRMNTKRVARRNALDSNTPITTTPPPSSPILFLQCSKICPKCDTVPCDCDDGCWPGKSLNATNDHTCECFAELGFCDAGTQPVYTPGKKCPSCWPKENKACDCFASIGFCG